MNRVAVVGAACAASILLGGGGARADECASVGPVADRDVPRDGDHVPANARFRVLVSSQCGGVENGPPHEFRVVDVTDAVVPTRRVEWLHLVELVPEDDLPPGPYELQVRRPVSAEALSAWETMVHVAATGERDERAPVFAGIESAEATVEIGSIPISPCQAVQGAEVRTRLVFAAADDSPRAHDELLYRLDRRIPGDEEEGHPLWDEWRTFRPTPEGAKWSFSWTDYGHDAWGATWEYRIAVRDVAGNETVGEKTVTVTAPARPADDPFARNAGMEMGGRLADRERQRAAAEARLDGGTVVAGETPDSGGEGRAEPVPATPAPQPQGRRGCGVGGTTETGCAGFLFLAALLTTVGRVRAGDVQRSAKRRAGR